jgi:lipopolysaccharide biosynthesis regulator YciM
MASVYDNKGDYEQALDYYLKYYKICLKKSDLKHPNTMTCIENMKITYNAIGKKEPFENWLRETMNKKAD